MTLNGEMAFILPLFYRIWYSNGRISYKVVDTAITMDNLRLLCLVENVCRGTARRPRYKYFITARWKFCSRFINSRCNAHYLPIWAFIWYQTRWPWMTLNGEMALILRYFTEFGSFRGALRKSGRHSHNYGEFTITSLVVNVCRGTARRHRINIL